MQEKECVCLSPYLLHNRFDDNLKTLDKELQVALMHYLDLLINILQDS